MTTRTVRYRVTCSTEDPHAPARVMGILAARSLLPLLFQSTRVSDDRIAIVIALEESDDLRPNHLARLFDRLEFVIEVELEVAGNAVAFRY